MIEIPSDQQTDLAIDKLLMRSSSGTRTHNIGFHPHVADLFDALKNDLNEVTEINISSSNVVKHLLFLWFDMVNNYDSDRLKLARYINHVLMRNRHAVMAKEFKHFSFDPKEPENDSETT
ncbi:hypothetical protein P2G88_01845 [Aliiglaciecola sp. CAU 1673]|uniref:hypothetical protein n=1 Tax=Aliiglaciecola sp. CAU 1673 TaxID=3032595 RepID=UPI0023DC2F9C|nr:hypothetical protein [Aliiglaciecola sp. CAU 1673]MDF2176995.1 hypothetical protein [Aliiglaciecola sp. CAU 1673]